MIEAAKFLTIALACIAGAVAFYHLCFGHGVCTVSYTVVGVVFIAMHIAIDEETKKK
jgi:hypothetical protein